MLDLAELVLGRGGTGSELTPRRRGILLDIGGEGSLEVRGQARPITQILVNLIGNAVRFSPEGGTVAIMLERGAEAAVTVADQGPGVAAGRPRREFSSASSRAPKRAAGPLALALPSRAGWPATWAERSNCSTSSGPGAAFRLTLPLA